MADSDGAYIGGVIAPGNHPGQGLCITLRVPLTLTIIPGLIVRAGGQHFAIPRAAVVEILHDNNDMLQISEVGGAKIATIRAVFAHLTDPARLARYPRARDLLRYEVRMTPGDLLFIPIGWWHQVRSESFSTMLTYTSFHWPNAGHENYPAG